MPDATQVQSFHDTIREWAYIGAQACANREKTMQEHFGRSRLETKSFMQEGLERFTAGIHIWDKEGQTSWGRGAATQGKHKKVLVAPKGALELAPK